VAPRETPKLIPFLLWCAGILFAQGVLDRFTSGARGPDFVLLFILFMGIRFNTLHSIVAGFVMGMIRDTVTFYPFGLNALVFVLAGYLPHTMRRSFYLEGVATRAFLVAAITLGAWAIPLLVFRLLNQEVSQPWSPLPWHLGWHLVLAWPLFRIWEKSLGRISKRKKPVNA
jgi:rod shape-determining protein MreD